MYIYISISHDLTELVGPTDYPMIDYIYSSVDRVDPTVKKNLVGMEEEPFLVTLEIDHRGRTVFSLAFTCTHAVSLAARALRHIVFMLIFVDLLCFGHHYSKRMTKSVVATPHQAGIIYTECVKSCRTDTLKEFMDGAYCGPLIQDQNESSIRDTNSNLRKKGVSFATAMVRLIWVES